MTIISIEEPKEKNSIWTDEPETIQIYDAPQKSTHVRISFKLINGAEPTYQLEKLDAMELAKKLVRHVSPTADDEILASLKRIEFFLKHGNEKLN